MNKEAVPSLKIFLKYKYAILQICPNHSIKTLQLLRKNELCSLKDRYKYEDYYELIPRFFKWHPRILIETDTKMKF